MKRRIMILTALLLMLCAVTALTSCGQWDKPYESLDKDGASISVKFLAGNGGMFAGTNGVTVVDVFNADDYSKDANGNVNISLIAPDDSRRGNDAFEISRTGHLLAGWYVSETVTDANGNELDADGNLVSASGKEPATTLRKWDFAKDKLTVKADGKKTGNEPTLTLTAMWVPYTNFVFHEITDGRDVVLGTYSGTTLDLPEWDARTGKLNYKNFITVSGKTLDKIYLDKDMTAEMTDRIVGNMEFGGAENAEPETVNVYTTWRDGEWIRITSADQLRKNAKASGCYELLSDLDFSDEIWSFGSMSFSGQIIGNGHKITGISTAAAITSKGDVSHGGVFGTLTEKASISDVTFENVTYTVKSALSSSANLGLLAGTNKGAALENVSITSSEIVLTADFCSSFASKIKSGDFKLATVFAEGDTASINTTELDVILGEGSTPTASVDNKGVITLTYPAA